MKKAIEIPNGWATRPYQRELWEYMAGGGKRTFCCIMSALPPKADITEGYEKCPLMTQSGHPR